MPVSLTIETRPLMAQVILYVSSIFSVFLCIILCWGCVFLVDRNYLVITIVREGFEV